MPEIEQKAKTVLPAMMMIKIIFPLFFIFILLPQFMCTTADAENGNIVLRYESEYEGRQFQRAVVFEDDKIIYNANANYAQKEKKEAFIGLQEKSMTDVDRKKKLFAEQMKARLRPLRFKERDYNVYLGPGNVKGTDFEAPVTELIDYYGIQNDYKKIEGLHVSRLKKGDRYFLKLTEYLDGEVVKVRGEVPLEELCDRTADSGLFLCLFEGHGWVFLEP
ncbi:MAG: hypothetical protein WCJ37_00360 [Syntrophus sp. (in: bacteria)]